MSISDLKHTLRKFDFPACAKEALIRTEQLLVARGGPSNKQLDVAMDIIAEFVFYETDRRGGRRNSGLSPLQELQLTDVLCEYLASCANETTKNTVFLSLFGGMEGMRRLKILSILASMAVSASSTPVLLAVGVWLQQMGCSSSQSLQLAENIIRDHFSLNTLNQASLRALATSAPLFVANFMTSVTELYMHDVKGVKKLPPKNLLEVITSWVYTNPLLCMSAQLNPAALPSGAIPMAGVTPLAGLVRWCALAPLYLEEEICTGENNEGCPLLLHKLVHEAVNDSEIVEITVPIKKIKLESEPERCTVQRVSHKCLSESELYTKLHLGVLVSLRAGRRAAVAAPPPGPPAALPPGPPTAPLPGPPAALPAAVSAHHLAALAHQLQAHAHALLALGVKLHSDERLQNSLDRVGQSVQVALANGCVYGNINSLLAALESLPENRLLRIIIRTHQQVI